MYLGWFDDTNKKPILTKIDEAIERFTYRFGVPPQFCLVSESELVTHPSVEVRAARHVRPGYFYTGRDDITDLIALENSPLTLTKPKPVATPKSNRRAGAAPAPATKSVPVPAPVAKIDAAPAPISVAPAEPVASKPERRSKPVIEVEVVPATPEPEPAPAKRKTAAKAQPVAQVETAIIAAPVIPDVPVAVESATPKRRKSAAKTEAAPMVEQAPEPVSAVVEEAPVIEVAAPTKRARKNATAAPVETPISVPMPQSEALVEKAPARSKKAQAAIAEAAPVEPVAAAPVIIEQITDSVSVEPNKAQPTTRRGSRKAAAQEPLIVIEPLIVTPIVAEPVAVVTKTRRKPATASASKTEQATLEISAPKVAVENPVTQPATPKRGKRAQSGYAQTQMELPMAS